MKARLTRINNAYHLLLSNGAIRKVSLAEAMHFLETFDSELHYAGTGRWNYEGISMEDYGGETVARVNDDGSLTIVSAADFRAALSAYEINYVSVEQYASKHGKKRSIIARMCNENRLPGVKKVGTRWLIPENAPYPTDGRYGKRVFPIT